MVDPIHDICGAQNENLSSRGMQTPESLKFEDTQLTYRECNGEKI